MFRDLSERKVLTRGASVLAGLMLVLQAVFVGVATAATAGAGQPGEICLTRKSASSEQGAPGAPSPASKSHHSGLCCVLHGGALPGPEGFSDLTLVLPPPRDAAKPLASYAFDASRAVPERGPQSPRAPPVRAV